MEFNFTWTLCVTPESHPNSRVELSLARTRTSFEPSTAKLWISIIRVGLHKPKLRSGSMRPSRVGLRSHDPSRVWVVCLDKTEQRTDSDWEEMETTLIRHPQPYLFMHDNAHCHKTADVAELLADNGIPVVKWPETSPDFNPIENLWHDMKTRARAQR
jgi:DDE superfamily endonuclease